MPRCAFLTLDDTTGWVIDDELAYQPLRSLGWEARSVSWRQTAVPWTDFDAVVIRSTWDYHEDADAFVEALAAIERAGTPLFNPLALVRWNLRKTYLRDLAERGVPVVPTTWRESLAPGELPTLLESLGAAEMVIKPEVGASAGGAYRVDARVAREDAAEIEAYYSGRALMAQPFVAAVVDEGEFSLFYFNGAHSHTILKTPKPADFRVQEEHGGWIRAVPAEDALRTAGDRVMRALGEITGGDAPLYARVDLVRADAGFLLMELELIEPSLYFRTEPGAAERFAQALDERAGGAGSDHRARARVG